MIIKLLALTYTFFSLELILTREEVNSRARVGTLGKPALQLGSNPHSSGGRLNALFPMHRCGTRSGNTGAITQSARG